MFTSLIVLLMITNTAAASGAVFVALQVSASQTLNRAASSKTSTLQGAEKS
jgi:hypothetical protein